MPGRLAAWAILHAPGGAASSTMNSALITDLLPLVIAWAGITSLILLALLWRLWKLRQRILELAGMDS